MADKKIKLSIAGQEVTCNWGSNWYYEHFWQITGVDMLVEGLKGIETTKMFRIIPAVYYAGYLTDCSVKKEEPKLKKEDFEYHVLSGDEVLAASMIKDYFDCINPKEEEKQGELAAQTESL